MIMTYSRKFLLLSNCCRCVTSLTKLIRPDSTINLPGHKFMCNISQMRLYSEKPVEPLDAIDEAIKRAEKSRTAEVPKIMLVDLNNNVTLVTLDHAEKIAHNNNLRLVQVNDPTMRSKRPVYQLMTEAQYLNEDLKSKTLAKGQKQKDSTSKGFKMMALSSRIGSNDLEMKIKKTLKCVEKDFEVRVIISGPVDNTTLQESIYKNFETAVKGVGRIVQKRIKGGDLRFQILPPKTSKTDSQKIKTNDSDDGKNDEEILQDDASKTVSRV